MMPRQWHLRSSLIALLTIISTISFLVVGATLLTVRLPQIAEETRQELRIEAGDLVYRSEIILGALQTQLELIAASLRQIPDEQHQPLLYRAVHKNNAFAAIYVLNEHGIVRHAAISTNVSANRHVELLGNDLSQDQIFLRVQRERGTAWSDKYYSPASGAVAVGIGVSVGKDTVIGEIPLDYILKALHASSSRSGMMLWIIDRTGELLADSQDAGRVGVINLGGLALLERSRAEATGSDRLRFEGREYEAAAAHSRLLNWHFLTRTPAGLANPRIGATLELGIGALAGSILIGMLLAATWATGLARPIRSITERARQIADGQTPGPWPRGRIIELNALSSDLERMAGALQEREQELETIFNASPVGIAVLDPTRDNVFTKLNDSAVHMLHARREDMIGKNGRDLQLWCNGADRQAFYAQLEREHQAHCETRIRRLDGSEFLAALSVRNFENAGRMGTILVSRDITELRRIEDEILQLNTELEIRVSQRTEELHRANNALSITVERLQQTQDELVRAEKLASLGALVAGIAHELNTPLGNALMAVSALDGKLKRFHEESATGLKRSSLDQLLQSADTGVDIALRNLMRASELVTSFKQVAADQTSSQRRQFLLDEVIAEILLTLHPMLKHEKVRVDVRADPDLLLDSYPGPLGQILTNLVNNAVIHAFAACADPRIELVAEADGDTHVTIRVSDNGCGIAADFLPRIFDPFVTTRMGRGGTGLGLHIVHNLVVQTLGGHIGVSSTSGEGTQFSITLPRVAPDRQSA